MAKFNANERFDAVPDVLISRNKACRYLADLQASTAPYDNSENTQGYLDGLETAISALGQMRGETND